jgi:GH24 family phage-related lysozyme (muramidase)
MRISDKGIKLIQSFESCELQAYRCPANVVTIGWGSTKNVKMGMKISQAEADARLKTDLAEVEAGVNKLVKVKITQGMYDALCSFAYNCGLDIDADTIAEGLGDSTLLKKLNVNDFKGAAEEFKKWNKGSGRVLQGLTRRREAEKQLFLS